MDPELPPRAIAPLDVTPTSELMSELAQTLSKLVSKHVELAKTEAIAQAKPELKMATGFAVAAVFVYSGFLLLLCAAVLALAVVMAAWAAALLVALAALAVAGAAALVGYRKRVRRPLWRTRQTLVEDARWPRPRTP